MSQRVILVEAGRNLRGRIGLTTLLSVTMVGLLALPGLAELWGTHEARVYQEELLRAGYYTLHLESERLLRPSDCARLGSIEGVVAAGGAAPDETTGLWGEEGPSVAIWRIDGALIDVIRSIRPTTTGASPWTGQQVIVDDTAAVLLAGVQDTGSVTLYQQGVMRAEAALSADLASLGGGFQNSLLVAERSRDVALCIALVAPEQRAQVLETARIGFNPQLEYRVSWAIGNDEHLVDPIDRYDTRLSQWVWLVVAIFAGLIHGLTLRMRRADLGLYRLLGFTRLQTIGMLLVELLVLAMIAAAVAVPLLLAAHRYFADGVWATVPMVTISALALFAIGAVGLAAITTDIDIPTALRDS